MELKTKVPEDSILTLKERHLHLAASLGDEQSIQLLHFELRVDLNARNAIDRTALHLAAGNGNTKCVQILVDNAANIEHADKYGMNAVLWAAWFGHDETLSYLIKQGASLTVKNKNGLTFLHSAASGGHTKVIDLLKQNLAEFNINTTDEKGQTAVFHAVVHNNVFALSKLLDHNCNIFKTDKLNQNTAIHLACELDRYECLKILLHHAKSICRLKDAISSRNKHYYTPLHVCAEENRVSCVKLLLSYQVDKNGYVEKIMEDYNVMMKHLESLTEKKRQQKELEITKRLGRFYDEITETDYLLVTTPLHLAAKLGFLEIVELLIGQNDILNTDSVISSKSDLSGHLAEDNLNETQSNSKSSNFDVSTQNSNHENSQLLENKNILNARNEQRQTALHLAAFGGHVGIVRNLASTGLADPSVQDVRQETPLHLSAEAGSAITTEILLQAGAIPFLVDLKGKTAVEVAARGNFVTVVDMIIKAERVYKLLEDTNQDINIISRISFGPDAAIETEHIRSILYKLSTKKFRKGDWNMLAKHWLYSDIQIRCIEEQFIINRGFKEHGHRFLLIWLFECLISQRNPIKELYEGLVGIRKKDYAEQIRFMANTMPVDGHCVIN